MIELWIDKHRVVLEPGTGIGFNRRSPLFEADMIKGSRSYNISAPLVPENDYIFEHARHIDIRDKKKAFDCTALFHGTIITKGKFVLIDTTDTYNGILTISEFAVEILDKNLRDFNYGNTVNMGSTSADVATYCQNDYKADGYSFPEIFNPNFYNEQNEAWLGLLNFKHGTPSSIVNTVIDDTLEKDNKYAFAPSFYIHWILERIADELGYTFDGDFFTKPDLDDLLLIGNVALDELGDGYLGEGSAQPRAVSGITEPLFSSTTGLIIVPNFNGGGNHHAYEAASDGLHRFKFTGSVSINTTFAYRRMRVLHQLGATAPLTTLDTFELNLVNASLTQFEMEVELFLNAGERIHPWITFEGSSNGSSWSIIAGNITDITWEVENISHGELNVFKKQWELADHMPDMTIAELLKELKKVFNLSVHPDGQNKRVTFTITEDAMASAEIVDWTSKIIRGNNHRNQPKLTFAKEDGRTFSWDNEDIPGDKHVVGNGKNEYKVKLAPMRQQYVRDVDPHQVRRSLPFASFVATTPLYEIGDNDAPWLMHFADNGNIQRSFQLRWNFNDGLNSDIFTTFWQSSIDIELFGERVEYLLDLDINDLQDLDFLRKVHLDGIMFLLLDQKNEYNETVGASKCELVKV